MLTKLTGEDWALVLEVFDACRSRTRRSRLDLELPARAEVRGASITKKASRQKEGQ